VGVGGRARNPIAFAKPFEQVAVLASTRAERRVLVRCRLAAKRARLGARASRHSRHQWRSRGRAASQSPLPPGGPAPPSIAAGFRSRR